MTTPESSNPRKNPADLLRTILHSPDGEEPEDFDLFARPEPAPEAEAVKPDPKPAPAKPTDAAASPLSRLPARKAPEPESVKPDPKPADAASSLLSRLPARKAPEPEAVKPDSEPPVDAASVPPASAPPSPPSGESDREDEAGQKSRKIRLGPAFWTVTGALSLIVNAVLIAILLILYGQLTKMSSEVKGLLALKSLPLDTVKGLYENFEAMEGAHIVTEIPVALDVPVQFDLQINQQVDVTLSEATPIHGAYVTLNTGGLNITNAPANIVLPAGTPLRLNLALTVPVERTISVSTMVPVDIALANTDLNVPFIGLQDVIEPLYCLLDPKATTVRGTLVCDEAKTIRAPQP